MHKLDHTFLSLSSSLLLLSLQSFGTDMQNKGASFGDPCTTLNSYGH